MTALEQMQELVRVGVEHGIKTVNVNHNDLKYLLVEVEQLRAKVTELQTVGSKLAYERQGIDKDRFAIAEKVRAACMECCRSITGQRASRPMSIGHADDAWDDPIAECSTSMQKLDLAKVLGS